jgi:gluconate:H+ symporter, GntP family
VILLHALTAIVAVVLLIVVGRVEPVIALVAGSLYLGLAAGLGFEGTITAVTEGFGDMMAEVGLLIGFGVLLGSLLHAMGALQAVVERLLRTVGPRRLPYVLAVVLSAVFPSIYVDVQLVLASPLARSAAPRLGRHGLPLLGGVLTTGILVGYVFVVPGLGVVATAGLLDVPLGTMLVYGFVIGPLTALLTVFLFGRLLRRGFWNPAKDEERTAAEETADTGGGTATDAGTGTGTGTITGTGTVTDRATGTPTGTKAGTQTGTRAVPLPLALLPIAVPLLLIAGGAISEAAGVESSVLGFVGNPVLALFVGLVGAYLLGRRALGRSRLEEALSGGFSSTGQILLITGVGGSLGAVIGRTDLDDVLAGLFSADSGAPTLLTVLLVWLVAAVLHLAIGSIAVAGIAAAGVLAPIMGSLGVPPEVLALAIGSGSLFALHVNSNFFWMFQTLLGVTTRGALKALTFVTALASVVSLFLVTALALVA